MTTDTRGPEGGRDLEHWLDMATALPRSPMAMPAQMLERPDGGWRRPLIAAQSALAVPVGRSDR